jgi:hypothetical protein
MSRCPSTLSLWEGGTRDGPMGVAKAAFQIRFLRVSCDFLRFTFDFSNEENPCELGTYQEK